MKFSTGLLLKYPAYYYSTNFGYFSMLFDRNQCIENLMAISPMVFQKLCSNIINLSFCLVIPERLKFGVKKVQFYLGAPSDCPCYTVAYKFTGN